MTLNHQWESDLRIFSLSLARCGKRDTPIECSGPARGLAGWAGTATRKKGPATRQPARRHGGMGATVRATLVWPSVDGSEAPRPHASAARVNGPGLYPGPDESNRRGGLERKLLTIRFRIKEVPDRNPTRHSEQKSAVKIGLREHSGFLDSGADRWSTVTAAGERQCQSTGGRRTRI